MELNFLFAQHLFIQYELNSENNYYKLVEAPPGFNKLPNELKFEDTQKKEMIKSPYILEGRISAGKRLFFTGLRTTSHNRIFYGDHFKFPNSKSLMFAVFSRDRVTMEIYFFNNFYPHNPTQREKIIQSFIQPFLTD